MSVLVTCGNCGKTENYFAFVTFHGRPLPANQWHCPECGIGWELRDTREPWGVTRTVVIVKSPRPVLQPMVGGVAS